MPYTTHRLNAVATVAAFMFGHKPFHAELVWLYYRLVKRVQP